MKKLYIALSVVLAQVVIIAALLIIPQLPSSKAVTWEKSSKGINISVLDSCGGKEITEQINTVLENYFDTFNPLYDKNIIHDNYYEIISNSRHISVLKVQTIFQHQPSAENKNYTPAGSKTVEIWFNIDDGELKTQIKEIENTMEVKV